MALAPPTTAPTPIRMLPGQVRPQPQATAGAPVTPQAPVTPKAPMPVGAMPRPVSAPPTTPQMSSFAPGVNTYSTNPASDLRGQTITPGPMANRMNIAQTYENNWNAATAPQFQADLRSATSQAAGAGQLGSGQLRTSLGNLAYNRDTQRNANESNFLNTALGGTIDDAYRNIGVAQSQQAFQAGLQNQTFQQQLQALLAGQSGNPADTQLALSSIYGNNASQAGSALSGLIGNTVNNNTQQGILQRIGQTAPTPTAPAATPPYVAPTGSSLYDPKSWIGGGVTY